MVVACRRPHRQVFFVSFRFGTFTKDNSNHIEKNIPLKLFDDFNDVLLDPSMTCFAVTRPEISTCLLLSDLITFAHRDLNLFGLISEAVSTRKFNIEVTSELISIVGHVQ